MPILNTSVDKLLDYVKARRNCNVVDASRFTNLSVKQVESIAITLCDAGMLDIKYGLTGVTLIAKKSNLGLPLHTKDEYSNPKKNENAEIFDNMDLVNSELKQARLLLSLSEREITGKLLKSMEHLIALENTEISKDNSNKVRAQLQNLEKVLKQMDEHSQSLLKEAAIMRKKTLALYASLHIQSSNSSRLQNLLSFKK
ncbi:hypothetical protein HY989_00800 [Candidatus Micrarchaeota archaeon]|nr:hypothetical protein [Candidatus Micrarchaeota archaeon]